MGRHEDDNGKYLGYFGTSEEAQKYITDLVDWYASKPPETRPPLKQVVDKEKGKGIKLHYTTLHREIKKHDVLIPKDFSKIHGHQRQAVTAKMPTWLVDHVSNYPYSSTEMLAWGWKIICGFPITDMITVFFGNHRNALFVERPNKIEVALTSDFQPETVKMIKGLVNTAQHSGGIQFIKQYAESSGLLYFGGDKSDKPNIKNYE